MISWEEEKQRQDQIRRSPGYRIASEMTSTEAGGRLDKPCDLCGHVRFTALKNLQRRCQDCWEKP